MRGFNVCFGDNCSILAMVIFSTVLIYALCPNSAVNIVLAWEYYTLGIM